MCGAFGTDSQLSRAVTSRLGFEYKEPPGVRLRPTDVLASIIQTNDGMSIHRGAWGIKPAWAKQLLINARAESVDTKPTFSEQYRNCRCLVPMSFWYESEHDPVTKKITARYRLKPMDDRPLFMAGIYYPQDSGRIVSITTKPNKQISAVKDRMPLIFSDDMDAWLEHGQFISDQDFMVDIVLV